MSRPGRRRPGRRHPGRPSPAPIPAVEREVAPRPVSCTPAQPPAPTRTRTPRPEESSTANSPSDRAQAPASSAPGVPPTAEQLIHNAALKRHQEQVLRDQLRVDAGIAERIAEAYRRIVGARREIGLALGEIGRHMAELMERRTSAQITAAVATSLGVPDSERDRLARYLRQVKARHG